MLSSNQESYVSLRRAASDLGVPMSWLKAQADAGGVPHLMCGRLRRFNVAEVERVLIDLARNDTLSEQAVPASSTRSTA